MTLLTRIGLSIMVLLAAVGLGVATKLGRPSHALQSQSGAPQQPTGSVPPMEIGMNLGSIVYWSQEFRFNDIIQSSGLSMISPDGKWGDISGLKLDSTGHPIDVPAGTGLAVSIKSGGGDRLPGGTYNCVISPGWIVRSSSAGPMTANGTQFQLSVSTAPSRTGLRLQLSPLRATASLKQLSCRDKTAPPGEIFRSAFLDDNRPFTVFRFLDWMKANNQGRLSWATRTTPDSFSQMNPNGVAVEYMVQLANEMNSDPWFTLPLEADDDYYRQFALYVRDHLKKDRRAYVEVSNEVWNRSFKQSRDASAAGALRYPSATPADANSFYYADRVRAVMAIWSDVYKGQMPRIVRVLAQQAGSTNRAEASLSHENTAHFVDALAIAPYFGPPGGEPPRDVDAVEFLIANGPRYVQHAVEKGVKSKAVADHYGIRLITYEGGPDYVSFRPSMKDAFAKAEQDPRMYGIYTDFLNRWKTQVGGLFMPFMSVAERYGHKLYTGQPLSEAPKMRALVDFIRANHLNGGRVH